MDIRKLSDLGKSDLQGKRVIVRMDFDVPEGDYTRVESSKKTLDHLLENEAMPLLIGHLGRPNGVDKKYSLRFLQDPLKQITGKEIVFIDEIIDFNPASVDKIYLFENVRFDKREEDDDVSYAQELSKAADLYVNEAFAVSHRAHATIVGIPEFLQSYAGFRFVEEIVHLNKVKKNPERPLVYVISGIKKDKIEDIKKIRRSADTILVGGRLPEFIEKMEDYISLMDDNKLIIAKLNQDKEDITKHTIERFGLEIEKAKTIVLAGVMGKYEDPGQRLGTEKVFDAVAESGAYKVAGGGDTEGVLTELNLESKFDWISVGGGAMLTYLAGDILPGLEALKK